jgi:molybdopterin converting factor small subunit
MTTIRIPPVLRETVGGSRMLSASGRTVAEVLDDLFASYPALRDRVTEGGELSSFVNVYVNDRDVRYRDGLATPVGEDDTVILRPAMAGGGSR